MWVLKGKLLLFNLYFSVGVINDIVNKNLESFLKELMPVVEKALSAMFLEVGNDVVGAFTLNQLFPQ